MEAVWSLSQLFLLPGQRDSCWMSFLPFRLSTKFAIAIASVASKLVIASLMSKRGMGRHEKHAANGLLVTNSFLLPLGARRQSHHPASFTQCSSLLRAGQHGQNPISCSSRSISSGLLMILFRTRTRIQVPCDPYAHKLNMGSS